MNRFALTLSALAAAVAVTGCATDRAGGTRDGVSVTRFHLNQPIARGEIAVEPLVPAEGGTLQFTQIAAPVERELARLGWRIVRGNVRTEQIARVSFAQAPAESRSARGPSVGIGVGGGTGGVGVGVGGTVPVGGGSSAMVGSELNVRIARRSDQTAIWEGRAELVARAGTPLASPAAAADRLAEAMFRDFPGESGHTIRVR